MSGVGARESIVLPKEIVDQLRELAGAHYDGDVARAVSALLSGQVQATSDLVAVVAASTTAAREKEAARAGRQQATSRKAAAKKRSSTKKSTAKKSTAKKSTRSRSARRSGIPGKRGPGRPRGRR